MADVRNAGEEAMTALWSAMCYPNDAAVRTATGKLTAWIGLEDDRPKTTRAIIGVLKQMTTNLESYVAFADVVEAKPAKKKRKAAPNAPAPVAAKKPKAKPKVVAKKRTKPKANGKGRMVQMFDAHEVMGAMADERDD